MTIPTSETATGELKGSAMQQVNCLYCGKETPDTSATCIHCGAPSHGARRAAGHNRQKRFIWFFIVLTIVVVAAMFILPR